jgi:hypothetical protein
VAQGVAPEFKPQYHKKKKVIPRVIPLPELAVLSVRRCSVQIHILIFFNALITLLSS